MDITLKEYKNTLPKFSETQHNIIVGTLLGDASLSDARNNRASCNYKVTQSVKNKDYVYSIYGKFAPWCGSEPKEFQVVDSFAKDRGYVVFRTYNHKSLLFYHNQFYGEYSGRRKKQIPSLLHKWLNPEVLAYWFMDDGSKNKNGYYLHTGGYTYSENKKLAYLLGSRFGLQVSIHKDKRPKQILYKLYIGWSSIDLFTNIVSDYIHPCFVYKLHTLKKKRIKIT